METTHPIRPATIDDVERAAEVIALAFHDLPQAEWLVGSALHRPKILAANMTMWGEHAIAHGILDILGEFEAVAMWFDRELGPIPLPENYDQRVGADCGALADGFRRFDQALDRHHPTGPHHHLAVLAVEPDRQRLGLGAALLRHHHEKLDKLGLAAYIEASSLGSAALYGRHGYGAHREPYALPDDGPLMRPMWRHALV